MLKRTVIALSVALVMIVMAWPRAARAELPQLAGSVWGGEVDVTQRGALSVGMGWPSFMLQYDFHTTGRFGVGLRTDFYYGNPSWGFAYGFGWGFHVPMRINVLSRNDWSLAVAIDPGMWMGFGDYWGNGWWGNDWFIFAPRIGAGVIAAVQPIDALNVFFGMRLYFNILVIDPDGRYDSWADLAVQILPFAGVELSVHRMIALFFQLHAGPSVVSRHWCHDWAPDGSCRDRRHDVGVSANLQFYFGATFYFGR